MTQRFAADRMMGRLARMLRLMGYDTIYSPQLDPAGLAEAARREDRIILTQGETRQRFPQVPKIFSVGSKYPAEQLREAVKEFSLDPRAGLCTRCAVCNGAITGVVKE